MSRKARDRQASSQELTADSVKTCNSLASKVPKWLRTRSKHSSIVISTRIRLARNLAGFAFPAQRKEQELRQVVQEVLAAVTTLEEFEHARYVDLTKISATDRRVLMERRLASPEFIESKQPSLLIIARDEYLSMMVNEEDHLRIQSFCGGLSLSKAWQPLVSLDRSLSECLDYAFSERFGHLTACPTNTGTGMRASIFAHLPAISAAKGMKETVRRFSSKGITLRGFYGEGSKVLGNIYQISNQVTLGKAESELLSVLETETQELIRAERNAREKMLQSQRRQLEDQVWRAYATLKYARLLSSMELVNLLSAIRLGNDLGILTDWPDTLLNEVMLRSQPGHLQKSHGDIDPAAARDATRADIVREWLSLQC